MKRNLVFAWGQCLLLTIIILLAAAGPVYAGTYQDFEFTLNESSKNVQLKKYTGTDTTVTIPAKISGYPVTSIYQNCFKNNQTIENVVFENGSQMTSLGYGAFSKCVHLKKITLPASVRYIDSECFNGCTSLEEITLPEGFTGKADSIFWDLYQKRIFMGCTSLKTVNLPSSLSALCDGMFDGCTSLKSITLPEGLSYLGASCFRNTGITAITIPEGITSLKSDVFKGCAFLENVNLSTTMKELGSSAFSGCTALVTMKIPGDLKSVGSSCFSGCTSLTELKFGEAVSSIGSEAFPINGKLMVYLVRGTKLEVYCINNNVPFKAYAVSLSGAEIGEFAPLTYNGKAQTPDPVVTVGDETLKKDVDYTASWSDNTDAGKASVTITGIGNYLGTVTKNFTISAEDISKCKISLAKKSMVYTASRLTPSVKVTFNKKTVNPIYDYNVSYVDNTYVGTATVTVTGKHNFINSTKVTFKIVPKAVKIKTLKKGSRSFTVKWNGNSIQTTGYQVQYALDGKFKKGVKTKTISSTSVNSLTVKKLKANKKYYVRVRTYKTTNGKKYYSAWSKAKSVTTKK